MADGEKVIEGLKKVWDAFNSMEHELYADYVFDALAMLNEQEAKISRVSNEYLALVGKASKKPTVVQCKDCKWFEMPRYGERGFCKNVELIRQTTFYCADGERRENE